MNLDEFAKSLGIDEKTAADLQHVVEWMSPEQRQAALKVIGDHLNGLTPADIAASLNRDERTALRTFAKWPGGMPSEWNTVARQKCMALGLVSWVEGPGYAYPAGQATPLGLLVHEQVERLEASPNPPAQNQGGR